MNKNKFAEIDQLENGTNSDKVIELRSVYKQGKHTVQPAWDKRSNWWAGVERLSDEDKKGRKHYITVADKRDDGSNNSRFVLENGVTFDLNEPQDKITWAWVKHLPMVAPSFAAAQSSKAVFYVHIEGREADLSNAFSDLVYQAMKYVMEDPTTNYENRALLLGHDMEGQAPSVVKQFLMDTAKKNPEKIMHIFRSKTMKMDLLYVSAKRLGLITEDHESGNIKYGRQVIGTTEKGAIAFLRENSDLLDLLEREVKPEYFAKKADSRDALDIVNDSVLNEVSYGYMKSKAKELGYDGSQKKADVVLFLESEGINLEALAIEEKAIQEEA
jgi:hypothetical protein